jgi:single-stranded DNA-binding protein
MNSCVLMAEIVETPQLRYTTDQKALAEMLVQFPGPRAEDPPATLKVVGWGNLAQEIQQNYHQGDRVIIEGRLGMNTIQRDGYKEKKAELTVQRIHPLGAGFNIGVSASTTDSSSYRTDEEIQPPPSPERVEKVAAVSVVAQQSPVKPVTQPKSPIPTPDTDGDDIPF